MERSLFDLTRNIVEETERQLLGARRDGVFVGFIRRHLVFPWRFLSYGLSELMHPGRIWAWLSFACFLVAFFFYRRGEISLGMYVWLPTSASIILFIASLFSVPSAFAFDVTQPAHIEFLANYVHGLGFETKETLDALEECVQIIADRAALRTNSFLWLIGTVWAFLLFVANQFHSGWIKLEPDSARVQSQFLDSMFQLTWIGVALFACTFVVLCHKKAMDAVFRRLNFAIHTLKYRLAVTSG